MSTFLSTFRKARLGEGECILFLWADRYPGSDSASDQNFVRLVGTTLSGNGHIFGADAIENPVVEASELLSNEDARRRIFESESSLLIVGDDGPEDSPVTRTLRDELADYNAFLSAKRVELERSEVVDRWLSGCRVDLSRYKYVRIFNRGSFELGGRYYGPWWVLCPSEVRRFILVNDSPVVELDYSAMNVELAYSRVGRRSRDVLGEVADIYDVPGFEQLSRDIRKRGMLMLLAGNSRGQAIRAIGNYALQIGVPLKNGEARALIDALVERHEAIAELHFKDMALPFQRAESKITEEVIRQSIGMDIPLLNIHDGYVVPAYAERHVRDVMEGAFRELGMESIPLIRSD
jgi:hypothetical protein